MSNAKSEVEVVVTAVMRIAKPGSDGRVGNAERCAMVTVAALAWHRSGGKRDPKTVTVSLAEVDAVCDALAEHLRFSPQGRATPESAGHAVAALISAFDECRKAGLSSPRDALTPSTAQVATAPARASHAYTHETLTLKMSEIVGYLNRRSQKGGEVATVMAGPSGGTFTILIRTPIGEVATTPSEHDLLSLKSGEIPGVIDRRSQQGWEPVGMTPGPQFGTLWVLFRRPVRS